jgi:hypothetical protein
MTFKGKGQTWLVLGTALVVARTAYQTAIDPAPLPFPGNTARIVTSLVVGWLLWVALPVWLMRRIATKRD